MNATPDQKLDLFVSVVAPLRNAGAYVERFVAEAAAVLSPRFKDFEIVLVDNGSRDDTIERVERIQKVTKNVQLYCLVSRIEEESAYIAGLEQAIGDVVITMDPRVDPPQSIPAMLAPLKDGIEIVYGQRVGERVGLREHVRRGILRAVGASVRRRFGIAADASDFRIMSRKVINAFLDNTDRYALFPVIAGLTGFAHTVVRYEPVNITGAPLDRSLVDDLLRLLRIMLLTSKWPLRMLVIAAVIGATINLLYSVYVVIVALFVAGIAEGWVSLSLQMASMFFIMFVILGVLSDYVLRLVAHNQRRPHYLIARERSSLVLSRKQELNVALATRSGPSTDHVVPSGGAR